MLLQRSTVAVAHATKWRTGRSFIATVLRAPSESNNGFALGPCQNDHVKSIKGPTDESESVISVYYYDLWILYTVLLALSFEYMHYTICTCIDAYAYQGT